VASPADARPVMLVTGAARGIGAAIARAAAPTYDVVVNYVSSSDAAEAVAADVRAAGAQALVHQADVGVEAEVVEMFEAIDQQFGRVDVLINNAGIAGGYGRLEVVTAASLAALWAINITGAFICAREAVTRMSTSNGGRGGSIINISSKAAVIGGPNEWIHYAASKGAIDTMTAGLSKEVAAEGIRVNSVRPGLIDSDFHLHATPGRLERMAPVIPMQRAGTADEVAAAVLWLASDAASYVTGAFVDVSGGR
jgi:NAD(P)-dependent dehydrogenase (short-subunit alcohol dehydrogenase family)